MAMKLTSERLIELGACEEQIEKFDEIFPEGTDVTIELAVQHANTFNWNWAAEKLLTTQALQEYERINAQALQEYERVRVPAWQEYRRVNAQALQEYYRVRVPALQEYQRVNAQAFAETFISQDEK